MSGGYGSEQSGVRPVLILQNDKGNAVSPVTTVIPLTTRRKHPMSTHVPVSAQDTGSAFDSFAMVEQIRVVDKMRLLKRLGKLTRESVLETIGRVLAKKLNLERSEVFASSECA